MLSQADANQCIEEAAAELKALSYDELMQLAARQDKSHDVKSREMQVAGETVYANTRIFTVGRLRKRVGVEMTLSTEGGREWAWTPCVYFERFEKGHLYVARRNGWDVALFRTLPYLLIGILVTTMLALVWHFFLRE